MTTYTVGDTCGIVSLALPLSYSKYDSTNNPDPLQLLLSEHTVTITKPEVIDELKDMAQYNDVLAAAAQNVLQISSYHEQDPRKLNSSPNSLPNWNGLDAGETEAILLANTVKNYGYDYILTDEFNNRAKIAKKLHSSDWLTSPDFIKRMCDRGGMSSSEASDILDVIERIRGWDNQAYFQQVRRRNGF